MRKIVPLLAILISWGMSAGSVGAVTISAVEGTYFDGAIHQPYAANPNDSREILANATDGSTATFYALGIDGSITINVSPQTFGSPATAIEITFGTINANFPESAQVFLDGVLKGELFNDGPAGSTSTNFGSAITVATTGTTSIFTIPIGPGVTELTLLDRTFVNSGAVYTNAGRASDGFDVGELKFTVVPLPGTAPLYLGGLGWFAFLGWRRRRGVKAAHN